MRYDFFERAGLIKSLPGQEKKNTYRDYPEHLLLEQDFFVQAREAGLSVGELRSMCDAFDGTHTPGIAMNVIETKIRQTERTLAFLLNTRERIQEELGAPVSDTAAGAGPG